MTCDETIVPDRAARTQALDGARPGEPGAGLGLVPDIRLGEELGEGRHPVVFPWIDSRRPACRGSDSPLRMDRDRLVAADRDRPRRQAGRLFRPSSKVAAEIGDAG